MLFRETNRFTVFCVSVVTPIQTKSKELCEWECNKHRSVRYIRNDTNDSDLKLEDFQVLLSRLKPAGDMLNVDVSPEVK